MTQGLFDLTGKTAAVVGAGSGIGEAVALGCAAQGARVICLDVKRTRRSGSPRKGRLTGISARRGLDICDGAGVEQAFRGSTKRTASTSWSARRRSTCASRSCKYSDEELSRVLDVNIKGNFNVLRAAGRVMTGAARAASFCSRRSARRSVEPGQSVYAVTKAGIVQLAKTAAAEFGPHGVRVNAIAPGRHRDAADRADQGEPDVVQRLRRQERVQPLGPRRGDGRADGVPGVRRGQLRDRNDVFVDGGWHGRRRALHAAGDVGRRGAPGSDLLFGNKVIWHE